jgi:hypothetical protein
MSTHENEGREVFPVYAGYTGPDDPLFVSHIRLAYAIELSMGFNEQEAPNKGEYFKEQFADFQKAVEQVPGYLGVFGTGYPFYAWNDSGGVHEVVEIKRFTSSFLPKISADSARLIGSWPCAKCQVDSKLPDLKTFCKPCEIVSYKPRDLFKALPDVDFWVVVDELTPEVEAQVGDSLQSAGFFTSDEDIKAALDSTVSVMEAVARGKVPEDRLPADLHIVTKPQLLEAMSGVETMLADPRLGNVVPILPRSLRTVWQQPDKPYNFAKDFLFSMTPSGWTDESLMAALDNARRAARVTLDGQVVEAVSAMEPKEARIIESTPAIRRVVEERVASWV